MVTPGPLSTPLQGAAQGAVSPVKAALKGLARGLARLAILPVLGSYRVRRAFLGDQAFRASSHLLSRIPGLGGDYLRAAFYAATLEGFGRDVQVEFGTIFSTPAARVGDNVYIGAYCVIGNVDLGADVLLGSGVHLLSGQGQHGIEGLDRPIRLQAGQFSRIRVGADTWIGNAAVVMADVGRQCVVGAGSVVTRDVPDLSIAAGNPARVLRSRA
jgi:acetyltransferase-like isoleucine patch superfamily enzyme